MITMSIARAHHQLELLTLPTIAEALPAYLQWLRGRKLSERTIETYQKDLHAFAAYLGAQIGDAPQIGDISAERIEAYQATRAHLKATTIIKFLTAVKSFSSWCIRRRYRADDPTREIDWPKKNRPLPRACSDDELLAIEMLLAAPPPTLDARARRIWLRDMRAITLMLFAGLRRSEAAQLAWADVDLRARLIVVRHGKGDKDRVIPMHDRISAVLEAVPSAERAGYVLGHKDGQPLSEKTIGHLFDRADSRMRRNGGVRISAHRLRHSFATQAIRSGADIRAVQELLGHADLKDTARYLHVSGAQTRSAIAALPAQFAQLVQLGPEWRGLREQQRVCADCGQPFVCRSKIARFCSQACKHRHYRTHGKVVAPAACAQCDAPLTQGTKGPKRRFCSERCRQRARAAA
ncbi:MAG TPA: tyrosine-type recombinase/integrase [Roseiflexaceae bacterium]|nr:tyrosine-type recombinase/integrase [Roseiflexaceae bacterium]